MKKTIVLAVVLLALTALVLTGCTGKIVRDYDTQILTFSTTEGDFYYNDFSALTADGTVRNYIPRGTEFGSPVEIEGWTDVEHLIAEQYAVFGITETGAVRCAVMLDAVPEDYYNFTGMDAERAAHFVKELRNLEMDILKLNERIDRLQ